MEVKMKKKVKLGALCAILVGAVMFSTIAAELSEDDEILERMAEVTDQANTYRWDMDMAMNVSITDEDGLTEMVVVYNGTCAVDYANRAMFMDIVVNFNAEGELLEAMTMEIYILDNVSYIKANETWGAQDIAEYDETWIKQDIAEYGMIWDMDRSNRALIDVSETKRLDDGEVWGIECYVFDIMPNIEQFFETMQEIPEVEEITDEIELDPSILADMVKELSMRYWIAKDTYYLLRADTRISFKMSSEDIEDIVDADDDIVDECEEFGMIMDANFTMIFYDYDVPVVIELPEEALEEALELEDL